MSNKVKDGHGKKLHLNYLLPYSHSVPAYSALSVRSFSTLGSHHGCREEFCSSYRSNISVATNDAYVILLTGLNKKHAESLLTKMDDNLAVVNDLEDKMAFDRTEASVYYYGKNISHNSSKGMIKIMADARTIPMALVVKVDEIWMSSPALLSMHSLFMRLNHKLHNDAAPIKSLAKLKKLVKGRGIRSGDSKHVKDLPIWLVLLENLLDVYPAGRKYRGNWYYSGYNNPDGISGFCAFGNWSNGDKIAKRKFEKIYNATKK